MCAVKYLSTILLSLLFRFEIRYGIREIAILTGGDAERCAEKFLTQHSLVLLQRNYRCRFGEIDLIMRDGAALVFIGEAPGHDEDVQGEPFVGAAGQLLNRIIAAIGLRREQVYILNIIKCRPPQNRNPQPDEIAACWPILQAQLACLRPRIICALGTFAAQTLLQTEERISRLRGRFHRLGDIQVMPTYHPAFLLRNAQYKRAVWEDMQLIQRTLGLR